MPSVELLPGDMPASRRIPASMRTVVDFPLVPVTIATGTSCTSSHGSSSGCGTSARAQVSDPRPRPTDTSSSSQTPATPCASAAASSSSSAGSRSSMVSWSAACVALATTGAPGCSPATTSSHTASSTAHIAYSRSTGAVTAHVSPMSPCQTRAASLPSTPRHAMSSARSTSRWSTNRARNDPSTVAGSAHVTSSTPAGPSSRRLGPVRRRTSTSSMLSRPLRSARRGPRVGRG